VNAVREVQIPLVAALLFGGCAAKLIQLIRAGAVDAGMGPGVLLATRLRWPLAITVCALECGLGAGLIVTAGSEGLARAALAVRLGTGLMFLIATSALIELRASRPDVGCGCFGDFSTTPVSARAIARPALLAAASLATIGLRPVDLAKPGAVPQLVIAGVLELLVLGALSPELGQALIRLGYSEPCELHDVPTAKTMAALHRSKQWRKTGPLITDDVPVDVWRELCWRYVVYPTSYADGRAEVVFAVSLQRRPAVRYAFVHAASGQRLPGPELPTRRGARPTSVMQNTGWATASLAAAVPGDLARTVCRFLPISSRRSRNA
jgi:hypothetical protein